MNPIPIPPAALLGRPECQVVRMGPPRGVDPSDCGTVEMLISPAGMSGSLDGRRQYAYFRPDARELAALANGGFIEFMQMGYVVQPFSVGVWFAAGDAVERDAGQPLPDDEEVQRDAGLSEDES